MNRFLTWIATTLCVAICATLGAAHVWTAMRAVGTADRNGDGHPDLWRHFDGRGQITEIDVDTNFDGQPDVQEYYERGALVRRESDRNFNGQADLIEEFDAVTHGQTRAVIDVDFDGSADLLVLFRDGRPVWTKRAGPERPTASAPWVAIAADSRHLVPLVNPFDGDTVIRAGGFVLDEVECVGLATCGGLPAPHFVLVDRLFPSTVTGVPDSSAPSSSVHRTRSPRAPPVV